MEELELLRKYLLISIKRNGNQALTVEHLANLIGVIIKENTPFDEASETDLY